jgi:hypothetical protein
MAPIVKQVSSIDNLPSLVHRALSSVPESGPYPRFVIDEVLNRTEYLRLLASFPDNLISNPGHDGFINYNIRHGDNVSVDLSNEWSHFLECVRSPKVVADLVKATYKHTTRRYPMLWRFLLYPRLRNPRNYMINVAFSANYAGRYLAPHSDNSYKVLALVLYFADPGTDSPTEGTQFYRPRSRKVLRAAIRRFNRLSDSRLTKFTPIELLPMASSFIFNGASSPSEREKNEAWFYENFENDFNVNFFENRIAGFIKTQNSFHAVDMRESTFAGPRRSLLINLNLKHSLPARAWQSFRTRVLGLSS